MKNLQSFLLLFAPLLFLVGQGSSENILIFHHFASYSHRVQTWPLGVALSERGHNVSYIAPFANKVPHPNISEVVPQKLADYIDVLVNGDLDITLRVDKKMMTMYDSFFDLAYDTCEATLESTEFKEWLKKGQKFDLFIIDNCFPECAFAIAHHVGAKKLIIFNTVVPLGYEYDVFGYLPESSAIPELDDNPNTVPMSFFERVSNTFTPLRWRMKHYLYSLRIDTLLRDFFNAPNMPFIEDFYKNISLIFYTGDVITDYARAMPPLFVNVAGTHCRDSTQALPKEMEIFINATKPGEQNDGFIFISLGSAVISSNLPENIKKVFFDVIKSFPNVKFLWKWVGDLPAEIPENLYLSKWFPQIDVLGHPKIRGFVTQNGRPSTLEALYLGVPMISFPIFGDQDLNANRMAEMGATIPLEIGTVTVKEFGDAVEKVVYDPSVKARMTRLQTIFRDRPMTPVDTAMWWIDYVLRHEDTAHLRPSGNDQYWFVRRQVDVWAFVTIAALLVFTTILVVARKSFNIIMTRQATTKKLKKM